MKTRAVALLLALGAMAARGDEPLVLDVHESRIVVQSGATAAYTLEPGVAEPALRNGAVTLIARAYGVTQLVVVSGANVQTINIVVRMQRAKEIAARNSAAASGGAVSARYMSSSREVQTSIETKSTSAEREQRLQATIIHGGVAGRASGSTAIASASYSINTPKTRVTLLDEAVHTAPLVIEQQIVRGVHVESRGVAIDAGVTAPGFYDGIVLPLHRQFVAAASYAWKVSPNLTIQPAAIVTQRQGIVSLLARYERGDALQATGEIAQGRGTAAAFSLFADSEKQKLAVTVAWRPRRFVTASAYDHRGLTSSAAWSATISPRLSATASGSIDHAILTNYEQRSQTASAEVRLKATKTLSIFGGARYGGFDSIVPAAASVRSLTIPVGMTYDARAFSATALARFGDQTLNGRARGYRLSARGSVGRVSANAFVDTETNAPTLDLIFRERPDLELLLQQLGLSASSPEDIARILRDHADLIGADVISSATVNLAPRRTLAGLDVSLLGERQSLRLRLLRNRIESVASTSTLSTAALTYTRRLGDASAFDITGGLLLLNRERTPYVDVTLRHSFDGLPSFGRGSISGVVFADDEMTGHGDGLAGVTVQLDAMTTTQTDGGGGFTFRGLNSEVHQVTVHLQSPDSYFTTASRVDASSGDRIRVGIAHTPARVSGRVRNDAGLPVQSVNLTLTRGQQVLSAVSDSAGAFEFITVPGQWTLAADAQSLPAGYAADIAPLSLQLTRGASTNAAISVRAMRTISGAINSCGHAVNIDVAPLGRHVTTDNDGHFVIRNLPSGNVTLNGTTRVTLPEGPALIKDVRVNGCAAPTAPRQQSRPATAR
ncbi:MAG TPA: carboxypeptidase regulatory-like domain-containing protein [Thermoanaerobaculia bacterium]|nr:carboxypeptidase regulatory-like domain-containing protein [Thermoanaerobaculia bacterium]